MSDEREQWAVEPDAPGDEDAAPGREAGADPPYELEDGAEPGPAPEADDYALLSLEAFDHELEALATYAGDQPVQDAPSEVDVLAAQGEPGERDDVPGAPFDPASIPAARSGVEVPAVSDDEQVRMLRAQRFRRGLRNQIGMLPLALYLLALGGYLLARRQGVDGLPQYTDAALGLSAALALSFTLVFHALIEGRRERGLLFVGAWVWAVAGGAALVVYGLDESLDLRRWWPIGVWAASPALVLTYLIERAHDGRLVLLGGMALAGGSAAYAVSSEWISAERLEQIGSYGPLLLVVLGIGLLPLAVRRHTE